MKSVLKMLGFESAPATVPDTPETETVRHIIEKLDQLPVAEARYVAAFAYILGRVANADLHISEAEVRAMEDLIVSQAGLNREQAIIVVQMAKTRNTLFGGTEDFLVTREFNKITDRSQKLSLLKCLFALSASDLSISVLEDNEIGKIARELGLEHRDFIEARRHFRNYLAVLKKGRNAGP